MKNIIISDNNINILSFNSFKNFIYYNKKTLYDLYDGRFINPPFFDKIIITRGDLNQENLQMIYNMLSKNGILVLPKKYSLSLEGLPGSNEGANYSKKEVEKTTIFKDLPEFNKKFLIFKKLNNYVYQFPKNRVVDFIIMGAQKAGTTALSLNISKHPDIYIDNNKNPALSEVHFFDINFKKGIEWYKKKFNYSKKMVGEKTPELMYLDWTFPLIQAVNPYVKLIVILRNPILRAYSAWKHAKKNFNEKRSFEDSVKDTIKNSIKDALKDASAPNQNKTFYTSQFHYLQRGLYYQQITELLKWFPKDNLLVLIQENVIKNMTREYNKVYNFLNLPDFNANYELEYVSEDKSTINQETYKKLIRYYRNDVDNLEKLLGIKLDWF